MFSSDWSSDVFSSDLLRGCHMPQGIGRGVLIANCLAQSLLAVGVVASLYARYLAPEYRVTASQLSALINGFATILLFAFIDPQLSVMTDDARSEEHTSELQSLMRIPYAVLCLKKKKTS